jgi:hypothetical protein
VHRFWRVNSRMPCLGQSTKGKERLTEQEAVRGSLYRESKCAKDEFSSHDSQSFCDVDRPTKLKGERKSEKDSPMKEKDHRKKDVDPSKSVKDWAPAAASLPRGSVTRPTKRIARVSGASTKWRKCPTRVCVLRLRPSVGHHPSMPIARELHLLVSGDELESLPLPAQAIRVKR